MISINEVNNYIVDNITVLENDYILNIHFFCYMLLNFDFDLILDIFPGRFVFNYFIPFLNIYFLSIPRSLSSFSLVLNLFSRRFFFFLGSWDILAFWLVASAWTPSYEIYFCHSSTACVFFFFPFTNKSFIFLLLIRFSRALPYYRSFFSSVLCIRVCYLTSPVSIWSTFRLVLNISYS